MEETTFDPDLVLEIFKIVWTRGAADLEKKKLLENVEAEAGTSTFKKSRLSFEAIQRASSIAEAEGSLKIETTHLERILPQLLLDF